MIPKFVNRRNELEFLENTYKLDKFSLVVIYGRRRVGKTDLIKNFLKNKKGIYLLCTDDSVKENIESMKRKFYQLTNKKYFLQLQTDNFYDLFDALAHEIKEEKVVIVIDEFPYLLNLNKGYLSVFQKIIDEILKDTKIMLILTGSSMSVMENDVLAYKSPIYGRFVRSWKLKPLKVWDLYNHFGNIVQTVEYYLVFGGVPYYLHFYDKKKNLMENLANSVLTKGRELYDEPLILLRNEFRESRTYRNILKHLALGYNSLGKLCSATGLNKNNLTKYLATLEETDILQHIIPYGKKRKGIYKIKDNFFRFWFRFVYPHRDYLEMLNMEPVKEKIESNIGDFMGESFEYMIIELIKSKLLFPDYSHVYKWWYKDKELDILALNEKEKKALIGECKWQDDVDAKKVISHLQETVDYVKELQDYKVGYAVFARSFKQKTDETKCFDLEDLEKIFRGN